MTSDWLAIIVALLALFVQAIRLGMTIGQRSKD